jgi:carboxyl-terminal processing protease
VAAREPSLLETSLQQQNLFFEFANQYAAAHDTLDDVLGSDELYSQFMTFVEGQNFSYETPSERYLAKIDSSLGDSQVTTEGHVQALQQSIEEYKKQAFIKERSELEKVLYFELLARFTGDKGQTAALLPHDRVVNEAVDVLQNPERYNNILSVSN